MSDETDRAAQAFADAIRVPQVAPTTRLYIVRCIFCKHEHESEFFDEIEEQILRCRDAAPEWRKGTLETFRDPGMRPISVETCAHVGGFV